MSGLRVFEVGSVITLEGNRLVVGVDHDAVTIGHHAGHPPYRLGREQAETFARLYVHACWLAGQQDTP